MATIEQICRKRDKTLLELLHPTWFSNVNVFPEDDFPCQTNCSHYAQLVNKGYEKMRQTRIVFAGLCINIEKTLPSLIKRLEHLGSFFKDYRVVIFENDSKDKTRDLLLKWQADNNKVNLLECPEDKMCKLRRLYAAKHGSLSHKRMRTMAEYRNRILAHIKQNYSDFDTFAIIDLDIRGPISIDGIATSFGSYDLWDCISAYGMNGISMTLGIPIYYDLLAYKDDTLDMNKNFFQSLVIINKMFYVAHKGGYLIPVKSGFAGMAIYKMDVIIKGVDYSPKDDIWSCEHIIFHENMYHAGFTRIYINPNMKILVGPQGDTDNYPMY